MEEIANTNAESFYRGDLADKIDEFSRRYNGYIRKENLAGYKPEWVDPIKVNYKGYDVWEIPPNGHDTVSQVDNGSFGRGQIIWKDENGVLCGGTESRADGYIAVY